MRKIFTILLILCFSASVSYGQLKQWSFNAQTNAPAYNAPGTIGSNAVFHGLETASYTAGFDPTNAPTYEDVDGYAYTSDGWSTSATVDPTDYLEFTVSSTGDNLDFSFLEFVIKRDADGPQNLEVYTDVDGFASPIAFKTLNSSGSFSGFNINLNAFNNLPSLTIRVHGFNANTSFGTLTFDEMTFQTIIIVPVELAYFDAEKMENSSILNWATYSELENETYVIERSHNGLDFEAIDEIDGAGTSAEFLTYEFEDENPINGRNYYRLRMIDFAGESTFSAVKTVQFQSLDAEIKLYPNPVVDFVTLSFEEANIASVMVYNLSGQVVRQINATDYDNQIIIETGDLRNGQYLINIQTTDNQTITKNFMKF